MILSLTFADASQMISISLLQLTRQDPQALANLLQRVINSNMVSPATLQLPAEDPEVKAEVMKAAKTLHETVDMNLMKSLLTRKSKTAGKRCSPPFCPPFWLTLSVSQEVRGADRRGSFH